MFALTIILAVAAIVIFGVSGWIYLEHKSNKEEIENYFRENFDKF